MIKCNKFKDLFGVVEFWEEVFVSGKEGELKMYWYLFYRLI